MKKYRVIIRRMGKEEPFIVHEATSEKEAQRVARLFCGKGWNMDRRPGVHTFGNDVALTVERD